MSLNIPERFLATARNDNQNKSFVISNEVRDLSQIEPLWIPACAGKTVGHEQFTYSSTLLGSTLEFNEDLFRLVAG